MREVSMLGIMGASYCGSTVLGMVLNTHPDMFSVGELYHVTDLGKPTGRRWPDGTPVVRDCLDCHSRGSACSILPSTRPFPHGLIHRYIAQQVDCRVLVDGSKLPDNFAAYEAAGSADSYSYVLMLKRPAPHFASFHRNEGRTGKQAALGYIAVYSQAIEFLRSRRFVVVSYEQFTEDLRGTLGRIAELAGVDANGFDPDNYSSYETHQVSGNLRAWKAKAAVAKDESWPEFTVEVPEELMERSEELYRRVLNLTG